MVLMPEKGRREMAVQFDVFLSHSKQDERVAQDLAERLQQEGLQVWFEPWAIVAGDSIPRQIDAGLENSRILLFCMSAHAFASDWAMLQTQTVRFSDPENRKRRMIPLLLEDVKIHGSLAQFKYIDWRKRNHQAWLEILTACRKPDDLAQSPKIRPISAPPPVSPGHTALRESLFADQQAGWKDLQMQGWITIFKQCLPEWGAPVILNSAQDFFDFCTAPAITDNALLYWLLGALEAAKNSFPSNKRALSPPIHKVFLAVCTVGVEIWMKHEASGVPLPTPDLAGGIRLEIDDPWALYLMTAVAFKYKSRIEPDHNGAPRALINVIAPAEIGNPHSLNPVESAIGAYLRTEKAIAGPDDPALGASEAKKQVSIISKYRLQTPPIFKVDINNDAGNALLFEEVQREVYALYNVPTVVSGGTAQCAPKLKHFAMRMKTLIINLNTHLYPAAPSPEKPA